jgi:hypothetical protein
MVLDKKLCHQCCDCAANEVAPLITSQAPRTSKPSNNVFKYKSSIVYVENLGLLLLHPTM